MGDSTDSADDYLQRGIVPFDTALFIEAAEEFADKVSPFTWQIVESFDSEFEVVTKAPQRLTEYELKGLQPSARRLKAFLIDGRIEVLGCRRVMRQYLSQFWREFQPVVAIIFSDPPPPESGGLLHPDQLKELRRLSDIIKFIDGDEAATTEETSQNEAIDSWVVAQKHGVKTKGEYLLVLLTETQELGISSQEYARLVVKHGRFPLVEYYNELKAVDASTEKTPPNPDFAIDFESNRVIIGNIPYPVSEMAAHYLHVLNEHRGTVMSDPDVAKHSEFLTKVAPKESRPRYGVVRDSISHPEVLAWIEKVDGKGHVLRPPKA